MSKQRTRKFVTKILIKTCSSLVKIFLPERIILRKISTISCKKEVLKISAFFAKNNCKSANIKFHEEINLTWILTYCERNYERDYRACIQNMKKISSF